MEQHTDLTTRAPTPQQRRLSPVVAQQLCDAVFGKTPIRCNLHSSDNRVRDVARPCSNLQLLSADLRRAQPIVNRLDASALEETT